MGLSGPLVASPGISGPPWAVLGLFGPLWASLNLSGPLWAFLGLSGALGLSGPQPASQPAPQLSSQPALQAHGRLVLSTSASLGLFGPLWASLGSGGPESQLVSKDQSEPEQEQASQLASQLAQGIPILTNSVVQILDNITQLKWITYIDIKWTT